MNQYGDRGELNLPIWTSPKPAILEPLRLPSPPPPVNRFKADPHMECLLCDQEFQHPEDHQKFLKHLLLEHSFVIGDVNLIANFPAYVRYWKNKFRTRSPSEFCSTMTAPVNLGNGVSEERDFFFLSDVLTEDKEIRKQLHLDWLEFVIKVQEEERRNEEFNRSCLFCRQTFTSSYDLIDHMNIDHNFNVGQPDNLVFINEFLDKIEAKLEQLVCLYCEKVFKSRDVLKEHMRKKGHKKLNPKNKMWDKYYLVNYLEFGKTWEDVAREDHERAFSEDLPSGWDHQEDDGDDVDWNDWRDDLGGAVCLFCPVSYSDIRDLVDHMRIIHDFDFIQIRNDLKLNFYQQVKMINYIRRSIHLNTCPGCGETFDDQDTCLEHVKSLGHHVPQNVADWDQPQFYFPTYENDNLLCGLEDDDRESEDTGFQSDTSAGSGIFPPVQPEDIPDQVKKSILKDDEVRKSLIPRRRSKSRHRKF